MRLKGMKKKEKNNGEKWETITKLNLIKCQIPKYSMKSQ